MKAIKIIQVTTPMFEYKGVKYYVEQRRYPNFNKFQDYIDRMIRKGATHLFIYNTMNTYPDDKPICDYGEGMEHIFEIWIRCKFVEIKVL